MQKIINYFFLVIVILTSFYCKKEFPIEPGKNTAAVFISSYPNDAEIYLNNFNTYKLAPDSITNLKEGVHSITLKKYGFYDTTFTINVLNNHTSNYHTDLSEDPDYWWLFFDKANFGLPGDWVDVTRIDMTGKLWVGMYEIGVGVRSGSTWQLYTQANSLLPSNIITSIETDHLNNVWIGTVKGLAKFDGSNWTIFDTSNSGLPSNNIFMLSFDSNKFLWLGTSEGITRFDGVNWWTPVRTKKLVTFTLDRNNIIYYVEDYSLRHQETRLFKYERDTVEEITYPRDGPAMLRDAIHAIRFDKNGNLWIRTQGKIAKYDFSSWQTFYKYGVMLNIRIKENPNDTFVFDDFGNAWIGTEMNGLIKFNGKEFFVYREGNTKLKDRWIIAIHIDSENNKWIATPNGIALYYGSKY